MDKLKKILEDNGLVIAETKGLLTAENVELNGKPIKISVYFEPGNFQIDVGHFGTLDKVESQELDQEDIAQFVQDFATKLKEGKVRVLLSHLFGMEAYTIFVDSNGIHTQYSSLKGTLIKLAGKKERLGSLSVV